MRLRSTSTVLMAFPLLGLLSCGGGGVVAAPPAPASEPPPAVAAPPSPPVTDPAPPSTAAGPTAAGPTAAAADVTADLVAQSADGRIAVLVDGEVVGTLPTGSLVAPDGSAAVSALAANGRTSVRWVSLPSMQEVGSVEVDGEFAAGAFGGRLTGSASTVALARYPRGESVAETELVLADATKGETFRRTYPTHLYPEAIGTTDGAMRPSVFTIETMLDEQYSGVHPYRVRVVDNEAGDLQIPLGLNTKIPLDEKMAGIARTQAHAARQQLLFTLYRGVEKDGTHYAFVHTLGLYNGVYCLDLPGELQLDKLPGALALSPDERRLFVASANGKVASFSIEEILMTPPGQKPPVTVFGVGITASKTPTLAATYEHVWLGAPGGAVAAAPVREPATALTSDLGDGLTALVGRLDGTLIAALTEGVVARDADGTISDPVDAGIGVITRLVPLPG